MSEVTLDDTALAILESVSGTALIRNKSGKVVGRFYRAGMTDDEVYAHAHEFLDLEECRRRKAAEAGQGRPLAEVLARIQAGEARP